MHYRIGKVNESTKETKKKTEISKWKRIKMYRKINKLRDLPRSNHLVESPFITFYCIWIVWKLWLCTCLTSSNHANHFALYLFMVFSSFWWAKNVYLRSYAYGTWKWKTTFMFIWNLVQFRGAMHASSQTAQQLHNPFVKESHN